MEVLRQLILDILYCGPGPDCEGTLAAMGVVDVLDEDLEVEGSIVGQTVVMTHCDSRGRARL